MTVTAGPTVPALTFEALVEREPRLGALLKEAQAIRDPGGRGGFCGHEIFYRDFKPRLVRLVGWYRHPYDPVLSGEKAYRIAYRAILAPLPACRRGGRCACVWA